MSIAYVSGAALTFFWNRSWSFGHRGLARVAFLRYLVAYACGYVLNWTILWGAVDGMQLPHQLAQAFAVVIVAGTLFAIHKFWVFAPVTPKRAA